jgi:hypothetical protein
VIVRGPAVWNVNRQEPLGRMPVQLSPGVAVTVTEPVGAGGGDTVKSTVTACPTEPE